MTHSQRSLPGSLGYLRGSVAANKSLAAGLIPLSSRLFHCHHEYHGQLLHCRIFKISADAQQVIRAGEMVSYSKGTDSYFLGTISGCFPDMTEIDPWPIALVLDFCSCVMLFATSIIDSFVASNIV